MKEANYLDNLAEIYSAYFDVERDKNIAGRDIPLYSKNNVRNEKYVATKGMTLWAYETNEHNLVVIKKELDEGYIDDFFEYLKSLIDKLVIPHEEHRSTTITGIILTENLKDTIKKYIKNKSYTRYFAFSLKGWCDVRLIIVDLAQNEVLGSKGTKDVLKYYYPK